MPAPANAATPPAGREIHPEPGLGGDRHGDGTAPALGHRRYGGALWPPLGHRRHGAALWPPLGRRPGEAGSEPAIGHRRLGLAGYAGPRPRSSPASALSPA